jgi:hypothetical protein
MKKDKTEETPGDSKTLKTIASAKRAYFKQADFPQTDLQQAQKIASALVDNFAAKEGSPPDIALAIGISPTSSAWAPLAGSSVAYGLTAKCQDIVYPTLRVKCVTTSFTLGFLYRGFRSQM